MKVSVSDCYSVLIPMQNGQGFDKVVYNVQDDTRLLQGGDKVDTVFKKQGFHSVVTRL